MGILIDLRKAFNTVDHEILVENWNVENWKTGMVYKVQRMIL